MKRMVAIATAVVCSCLVASVAVASPLKDYSLGKTAADYTCYPNENVTDSWSGSDSGTTTEHPKKANYSWGVTTGLDGNLAVQYPQFNPKMDDSDYGVKTQEINVLYKLNQQMSAFVGWHQGKYSNTAYSDYTMENENAIQVGLVGSMPIAPKTELFGVVGLGKDLANYEAGISYKIAKNLDVNAEYRYKKVKNLEDSCEGYYYHDTITAKGVGLGITYSF